MDKGYYKCWVCDTRGKNIYRVIRRFGSSHDKAQWREFTDTVDFDKFEDLFAEKVEEKQVVEMPEGFVSLANKDIPPTGFAARNYLRKRGIDKKRHCMVENGLLRHRRVRGPSHCPSFDEDGDLTYFVSRAYDGKAYPKYKTHQLAAILYSIIYL